MGQFKRLHVRLLDAVVVNMKFLFVLFQRLSRESKAAAEKGQKFNEMKQPDGKLAPAP